MKNLGNALVMIAVLFLCVGLSAAQETPKADDMQNCPMHQQHMQSEDHGSHHAMVEKHGDQAMGFAHDNTTHHFRLLADGGAIEVTADDPADKTSTDAIRSHLSHVAVAFRDGDFSTPMFVHDSVPPGTTTMKLLKDKIRYSYEEMPAGGRVRIASGDPVAVAAVQDFLRFQITEHETGDPLTAEQGR